MNKIRQFPSRHPVITILAILFMIFVLFFGTLYFWFFHGIGRINPGERIESVESPDGTYTVTTYLNNGGATVSYAVLGVLEFNDEEKKDKNIYWQYKEEEGNIEWLDDDTVRINDVELDVPRETYDYRHDEEKRTSAP